MIVLQIALPFKAAESYSAPVFSSPFVRSIMPLYRRDNLRQLETDGVGIVGSTYLLKAELFFLVLGTSKTIFI